MLDGRLLWSPADQERSLTQDYIIRGEYHCYKFMKLLQQSMVDGTFLIYSVIIWCRCLFFDPFQNYVYFLLLI